MAFSRGVSVSTTVAHATTVTGADDPTKEINKDQWNGTAAHTVVASGSETVVDAISGGIPYFSSTTAEGTSALLAANALVIGGGSGTAPFTSANLTFGPTAGQGLAVAAGTAASAVSALIISQTWNYNTTAITGILGNFTNTSSHANTLLLDLQIAGTSWFKISKDGTTTSGPLTTNATNGASCGGFLATAAVRINTAAGGGSKVAFGGGSNDGDMDTSISRISAGLIGVGTGASGSFAGGIKLTTLTLDGLAITKGYTVAALPAGVTGAICHVTDQLTSVAAKGVAPTGGGAVNCAVYYNGAAWVGI